MHDPLLINLVARIVQDHFGTPLGDPERPHLLLSKREAVAKEILDGLSMLGVVRLQGVSRSVLTRNGPATVTVRPAATGVTLTRPMSASGTVCYEFDGG